MSRIAKQSILIPNGVTVSQDNHTVHVRGSKGELVLTLSPLIDIDLSKEGRVAMKIQAANEQTNSIAGVTRTLVANMVYGVSRGWTKTLELVGVGYRASVTGDELVLTIGFSHPAKIKAAKGISFNVTENKITVSGADKQLVGEIAAAIRRLRPPEPYKGKGIRYLGEVIRKKAGKAVKAAAGGAAAA